MQAYLRVNGYFTVAEYPVVETTLSGGVRTTTNLDLLAFRFPHAGRLVPARGGGATRHRMETAPDPALGVSPERSDMIVGEVKEGRAVLNDAATDPATLRVALVRFGCCSADAAPQLVENLLRDGRALLPVGHEIRMVAFGSTIGAPGRYHTVTLGHVLAFLQDYIREHWEVIGHTDHKDPAFGFLVLLEKALRGATPAAEGIADERTRTG
ncbi:MAG TPA: hypothetical protein VMM18_03465 [Gemmatimonadaceae bacterium]|nr:hypothetical protein [Gemmatimonadaceae bacterium]